MNAERLSPTSAEALAATAPEPSAPLVSVLVPSWNMAAYLPGCLDALTAQDWPPERYEVIVIDDGSKDETREVVRAIRERAGRHVRYVPQPHRGLSAARNTGIAHAKGEIVCFVDTDEVVRPGHVRSAWELLEEHSDFSGIGGPVKDYGDHRHRTCDRCSLTAHGNHHAKKTSTGLLGGNMAIRREVFSLVGPFDEAISGRGDEGEWFHRANGLLFLFDPEFWLWHRRDESTLWALCRKAFSDGRARPVYRRKVGRRYRPRPWLIPRHVAHAVVRRCARGWILAFRQAGADYQHLRNPLPRGAHNDRVISDATDGS